MSDADPCLALTVTLDFGPISLEDAGDAPEPGTAYQIPSPRRCFTPMATIPRLSGRCLADWGRFGYA